MTIEFDQRVNQHTIPILQKVQLVFLILICYLVTSIKNTSVVSKAVVMKHYIS
jgi:hypothetical protein